jgi:hypothetical protein
MKKQIPLVTVLVIALMISAFQAVAQLGAPSILSFGDIAIGSVVDPMQFYERGILLNSPSPMRVHSLDGENCLIADGQSAITLSFVDEHRNPTMASLSQIQVIDAVPWGNVWQIQVVGETTTLSAIYNNSQTISLGDSLAYLVDFRAGTSYQGFKEMTYYISNVPEPATVSLLLIGLGALVVSHHRRRQPSG